MLKYGFIAQEVQQVFPDLVKESQWIDGSQKLFLSMGGMMPYVVGAIKELNLRVESVFDFDSVEENSFAQRLRDWFASRDNGIRTIFVRDMLCIGETCIDESTLKSLLEDARLPNSYESVESDPAPEPESEATEENY